MIQQQVLFLLYLSVVRKYTLTYRYYNILQVAGKSFLSSIMPMYMYVACCIHCLMLRKCHFFWSDYLRLKITGFPPFQIN